MSRLASTPIQVTSRKVAGDRTVRLTDLDHDTFYLIIAALLSNSHASSEKSRRDALISLSLVCTVTRAYALPWIFRDVRWQFPKKAIHPPSLWPYIVNLHLTDRYSTAIMDEPATHAAVVEAIPKLTSLAKITCELETSFSVALLQAMSNLPSLIALEFKDTRPDSHQTISLKGFSSLRSLVFTYPTIIKQSSILDLPEAPHVPSTYPIVTALLHAVSNSIETLCLSVSLVGFHNIASLEWPHLHSLTLVGETPPSPHMDITSLVCTMPNLRTLEVRLFSDRSPYILQMPSASRLFSDLVPRLETLVISNFQPSDMVLSSLPKSIETLSIRCSPVILGWNYRRTPGKSLSLQRALEIVGILGSQSIRLRTLALDLDNIPNASLVRTIALRLPSLRLLELKRNPFWLTVNTETLEAYATAVSHFPTLQKLNISLSIFDTDIPHPWNRDDLEYDLMKTYATTLGKHNSTLQAVAFLHVVNLGLRVPALNIWRAFNIVREHDGQTSVEVVEMGHSAFIAP